MGTAKVIWLALLLPFLVGFTQRLETRPDGLWLVFDNPPATFTLRYSSDLLEWHEYGTIRLTVAADAFEVKLRTNDTRQFWLLIEQGGPY